MLDKTTPIRKLTLRMTSVDSFVGEEVIRIGYKDERIWSYRLTCEKSGTIINSLAGVPLERWVLVEVWIVISSSMLVITLLWL